MACIESESTSYTPGLPSASLVPRTARMLNMQRSMRAISVRVLRLLGQCILRADRFVLVWFSCSAHGGDVAQPRPGAVHVPLQWAVVTAVHAWRRADTDTHTPPSPGILHLRLSQFSGDKNADGTRHALGRLRDQVARHHAGSAHGHWASRCRELTVSLGRSPS